MILKNSTVQWKRQIPPMYTYILYNMIVFFDRVSGVLTFVFDGAV